jgi:SAM-dependent methyltransferase
MPLPIDNEPSISIEDAKFDRLFPLRVQGLSSLHWTPVAVCAAAAELLQPGLGTRVLDVGCGPGKFCLVAASLNDAHFTGIDQRADLIAAARRGAAELSLPNVHFLESNVVDISFSGFDAFYIYNPFAENRPDGHKIDRSIPQSTELLNRYTTYVAGQLGTRPVGTRVVTYAGYANEIPGCYDCESTRFADELKLWVKRREYDAALEQFGFGASRSYRGAEGWAPAADSTVA